MCLSVILFASILYHLPQYTSSTRLNNACIKLDDYPFAHRSKNCYFNPDIGAPIDVIASRYGYPSEKHSVITSDGYILTLFRILPKNYKNITLKSPVYLQHGMASSAGIFLGGRNKSLALNLADLGHDVWLGNLRGTKYAKRHLKLSVTNTKFWNFAYHEKMIDVRAQLNYVAGKTGNLGNIIYIGHSLGNTLIYIYLLEYPEEAQGLIRGMVNIAPAVYQANSNFFSGLASFTIPLLNSLKSLGLNVLFHPEPIWHEAVALLSQKIPALGKWLTFLFCGASDEFPDEDLLLIWKNQILSSTSVAELIQIFQNAQSGRLQKYDYGPKQNLRKYGTAMPPSYDVANIKIPAYIFCGDNDNLVNSKDCERLYNDIGSADKSISRVPKTLGKNKTNAFNHADFFYGKNTQKLFYDELLLPLIKEKFK